ncbi:hypothetical protein BBP40_009884 [Aspergillus hancockii]|nr:hypothetical protein BBP40_009884 [Aspergillus hancockii]
MSETDQFKVIIVGGSVAGLTLAHCLQRAGIDHVVLEKSANLSPQVGASISVLPSTARILDQLGLYAAVANSMSPITAVRCAYPQGHSFMNSSFLKTLEERLGYPIAFLARQRLLEILHTSYPKASNIRTKRRVTHIRRTDSHVEVLTELGEKYVGDLVVGADGVHSVVRSEMWRLADSLEPGLVSSGEKKSMTVEFVCVFGTSSPVPGLATGGQVIETSDGFTTFIIHGKGGRIYWFVIKKLAEVFTYPETVRFTDADAVQTCQQILHLRINDNITFGHVWNRKEASAMTPLEEGMFRTWHYDRIVCIGDSIHKMTPNIGQGANLAIEEAALLASLLHADLQKTGQGKIPRRELGQLLQGFQLAHFGRAEGIYHASRFLSRFTAQDSVWKIICARYILPLAGKLGAGVFVFKSIADAPMIDFLPSPRRCRPGWIQYRSTERCATFRWALSFLLIVICFVLHSYITN